MRWKAKPRLRSGDKRIKTKFLFLPEEHDGEYRWWVMARVEQMWGSLSWYDLGWAD